MKKKIWINPKLKNLQVCDTKEFEDEIDPIHSENSCNKTWYDALNNKGKGCSFKDCIFYVKNNNGQGKGGKCGGSDQPLS